MINHQKLRIKYIKYFLNLGHKELPSASLIPTDDPTTLFTSAGMQQLIPYFIRANHPLGKRLVNIQVCFRTSDIDSVGDNRHGTILEMMGNWSLGDYFKKDQLNWYYHFLTRELSIPKQKLYVSVYKGGNGITQDDESIKIWSQIGISKSKIYKYDAYDNWWSRSGIPDKMPAGEIGGPSSEVFYQFDKPHDKKYGPVCHPNCNCGRFIEIGNSVFLQYQKQPNNCLTELKQKNVDFGGGLERTLAAMQNIADIYKTDLYKPLIDKLLQYLEIDYDNNKQDIRILADHLKASVFLITNGVVPSNKEHGYVLRRLLRRIAVKNLRLKNKLSSRYYEICDTGILQPYQQIGLIERKNPNILIKQVIETEMEKFQDALEKGMKYFNKLDTSEINEANAFFLYQTYGFPFEVVKDMASDIGINLSQQKFNQQLQNHQQKSRSASASMFKGGLENQSKQVIKYHTATHLLHQALRDVFGRKVSQQGSNITAKRLRFDFNYSDKITKDQIDKVEMIINNKIKEKLPINSLILKKPQAEKLGALSFFKDKYPDKVKVYYIGGSRNSLKDAYSKEFCGGPHVKNTENIGLIRIYKIKKIGTNFFRIYAR